MTRDIPYTGEQREKLLETARRAAKPHGVYRCGVCPLDRLELLPVRRRSELPERGTVLVVLLPYYTGEYDRRNVSLYAVPDDYHQVAGTILEDMAAALAAAYPGHTMLPFVDSSPIPEVAAGELAGLGYRGRNGQLITPWYGSMVFICEIVTDIELPPAEHPPGGSCGDCRRCHDACPTGALGETGIDAALCRSAITQKKGELTPWERQQVQAGRLAWGCDICTLICPKNQAPGVTTVAELRKNLVPLLEQRELDRLLRQKSYGWRGRSVLERNLKLLDTTEPREEVK